MSSTLVFDQDQTHEFQRGLKHFQFVEELRYMNNSPHSLQQQLLARVTQFQKNFPSITQAEIARHCGIGEANFSAAIAGRRGLSANSVLQLHKLLTLPRNQVLAKFHGPARTSTITSFQSLGQKMQLDNAGWVRQVQTNPLLTTKTTFARRSSR
jgi:hypothetical protein